MTQEITSTTAPHLDHRTPWSMSLALFAALASGGSWRPYPHLRYVAARFQRAVIQRGARIILNMPPQHGKSELTSYWLPLWILHWYPSWRVVLTSYSHDLAEMWAARMKDAIWEGRIPGIRPAAKNRRGKSYRWNVANGRSNPGGLFATGVGGGITGRPANVFIVDDPHRNYQDVYSEAKKRDLRNWWSTSMQTRLQRGASVIVIMTRWAEDDLTGWLRSDKAADGWEHIVIPAIAREGDLLGRPEGAPLCPELHPAEELDALRRPDGGIGTAAFQTMYDQDPASDGLGVISRAWFRRYDRVIDRASFDRIIQVWDLSLGSQAETASRCAGQVWGEIGTDRYLLDERCRTMSFTDMVSSVAELYRSWPETSAVVIESKASGPDVIDVLSGHIPCIIPWDPGSASKMLRAKAISPTVEAGRVHLPHPVIAPWIDDWIAEVATFPAARHDDRLDAFTMAMLRLNSDLGREKPILIGWV